MTTRKYSSRSQQTTLTAALTANATTTNVVSGASLLGGATIAAGETFTVVLDPDTALEEIVDITAVSTNTITITRGVETAGVGQVHSAGAVVRHMAIGRDYREANTHIENTTTAHGITLANVVKTTDTGTVSSGMIATGAVGTLKIDDLSVTEGKLAPTAVTAAKIATDAVITAKIQDGAVTSAKIADGTIVNTDINASAAIDKTKVAGTAVVLTDTGSVTSTMIADGTITNSDINASAGIAYSKLSLTGAITSSDITDGTIVNADISSSAAIALSKLATDPLARANHTGTQTASTVSDFDTQVRSSRLDQMAAPNTSVSANSQKVTNLATPTASTDASTKGYVDTQITNLIGTAPSTLDTLQEIATAINNDAGLYTTLNNGKLNRDGTQAMTGALAMGTNKITGLGDPTLAQDGATKNYVDTGAASQVAAAAASATAAASSATSASGSASSATTSASSATSSASSATSSASSATTSASNAATSATNAANSATSASGSASTATTQAGNAATSASSAATQASNAATSASSASTSATNAEASYDSFDDRYLGAKGSAPTLDNDGNALLTGALYWSTTVNKMFVWSGSAWSEISSSADIIAYKFTAAGGETSESGVDDNGLTLAYLAGKEQVYLNGVLLARGGDYTASTGSSITGLTALVAGDILTVLAFTAFSVANTIGISTLTAKGNILTASAASTPAVLAVGADGTTLVADSASATGLAYALSPGFAAGKNKIINGAFDNWQRGTSLAGGDYLADRFIFNVAGGGTVTQSRQSFTLGVAPIAGIESAFFYRATITVAFTDSNLTQKIEGVRTLAGQSATFSFYAKANAAKTLTPSIVQDFGSGGSASVTTNATAINLTTDWQRFTINFAVPSISGKTVGINNKLELVLSTGNQTGTFDIWGVQLEAGSVATAFQTATGTIQGELAACQRYYFRTGGDSVYQQFGIGIANSTTAASIQLPQPVQMRVSPTSIDFSTLSLYANGSPVVVTTVAIDYASKNGTRVNVNVSSGLTDARAYQLLGNNSLAAYVGLNAEL